MEEAAQELIGWLLQDMMRHSPETEIRLSTFRRGREIFDINSDFTVLLNTADTFRDANVIVRPLFSGGVSLYCAPAISGASTLAFIYNDLSKRLNIEIGEVRDALQATSITTIHQCPGLALTVELVRQGVGCALLPDFLVNSLGVNDFQRLASLERRCELYLSYYEREFSSDICREFIGYACG